MERIGLAHVGGLDDVDRFADLTLNDIDRLGSIDLNHEFFTAEDFQYWLRFLVILGQAVGQNFFCVVRPADQFAAADIAPPLDLWAMIDHVEVDPAVFAQASSEDSFLDDVVRYHDVDDCVDIVAFQEKGGLVGVAREAVEDETKVPVVFLQATLNDFLDDFVIDQFASVQNTLDFGC